MTNDTGHRSENDASKRVVTPDMLIIDFLNDYPELQPFLEGMIPHIQKLKSPALRNAVLASTTLAEAAKAADLSIGEVIRRIHKEAHLTGEAVIDEPSSDSVPESAPQWIRSPTIIERFDASEMIESGQHPVQKVMTSLTKLTSEQVYELITPFVPFPLIERAENAGFESWTFQESESGVAHTWFRSK